MWDLSAPVCKIRSLRGFKPLHLWQFVTAAIGSYLPLPPPSVQLQCKVSPDLSYVPRVSRMWVKWCWGEPQSWLFFTEFSPHAVWPAVAQPPIQSSRKPEPTASDCLPARPVGCVCGGGRGRGTRAGRAEPDLLQNLRASVPDSRRCTPMPATNGSAVPAPHPPSVRAHARPFWGSAAQLRRGQVSTPT